MVDDPSAYGDAPPGLPPPPGQPIAAGIPAPWLPRFAVPPPSSMERTAGPQMPPGLPPPPASAAPEATPDLPPAPDAVSGAGLAPAPPSPYTLPAPQGGHNAPSGPRDIEAEQIQQEADLQSQFQDEQAKGLQQAVDLKRDRQQAGQLMMARDQKVQDDAFADAQRVQDEARAMRVDPGHWWASRSTGQKIATVIGAMLGGFLQARQQRNSNPFMDSIQQSIHDDISAQQANMANARDSAGAKQSLYGMMLKQFGDQHAAYYAATAQMYDAAIDQVNADAAKFKSPLTQMEAQKATVALQKERDANFAKAAQVNAKNMLDLVHAQDEHAVAQANVRHTNAETSKTYAEAKAIGKGKPEATETVIVHGNEGSVSKVLDSKTAKLVNDAQKFRDEAHKDQSAKAGKHGAEYESATRLSRESDQRLAETMRAAGYSESEILAAGGGFQEGNIGDGGGGPPAAPRSAEDRALAEMHARQNAEIRTPAPIAPPPPAPGSPEAMDLLYGTHQAGR